MTGERRPLLATVGGNPVPVLLTMLTLRPLSVALLASPQSVTAADALRRCLRRLMADVDVDVRVAQAQDPVDLREEIHRAVETWPDGWDLAYSGGTPAMVMEAYTAWAARDPAIGDAWYVAEPRGHVVSLAGRRVPIPQPPTAVDLPAVAELHGWQVRGAHPVPPPQRSVPDAVAALRALPPTALRADRQRLDDVVHRGVADVLQAAAARLGATVYDGSRAVRHNRVRTLPFVWQDGLSLNLIDVAGYWADSRDVGHEVSLRWRLADLKERLFRVERLATTVGGSHARATMLLLDDDAGRATVRALTVDRGPSAGDSSVGDPGRPRGFAVFGRDEVLALPAALSSDPPEGDLLEWLSGPALPGRGAPSPGGGPA